MKASQLKRAQQIVEGVAFCKLALHYEHPWYKQPNVLYVEKGRPVGGTGSYEMSSAVRDVAFKALRMELESQLAAYRREAAQIGLVLDA